MRFPFYLSLCLLGTALVGKSRTPRIPFAANCKLKFVLDAIVGMFLILCQARMEFSSFPWQWHKRSELPPCLMNTETPTAAATAEWVSNAKQILQNGF